MGAAERQIPRNIIKMKMASNTLDERISKIKQQNEEIKRRHEEVEEDKKNAARLNALVQMVPSTDWPDRKEPPEFLVSPKSTHKQKSFTKEQVEHFQHHTGINDGKKYTFPHGEGPPPDPKYNFLADSEREYDIENTRDSGANKMYNKPLRGNYRKRGIGREGFQKDNKLHRVPYKDEHQPEYEAWRAERNRIDEDRISRQRTAEGNWRREWDNEKTHTVRVSKSGTKFPLTDFIKKDKDFDKKHIDDKEYVSYNRGTYYRPHQGSSKSFQNNYDSRRTNSYDQYGHVSSVVKPSSPPTGERTVTATDKSIKITLNQGAAKQGRIMSVKVSSPPIAGTGRVGPRQRCRLTYSSHSDIKTSYETDSYARQKSFEEKPRENYFNNTQKSSNLRRTYSQKNKESVTKSLYSEQVDVGNETASVSFLKSHDNTSQLNSEQNDHKDSHSLSKVTKPPRKYKKSSKNKFECKIESGEAPVDDTSIIETEETNSDTLDSIVTCTNVLKSVDDVEDNTENTLQSIENAPMNSDVVTQAEEIESSVLVTAIDGEEFQDTFSRCITQEDTLNSSRDTDNTKDDININEKNESIYSLDNNSNMNLDKMENSNNDSCTNDDFIKETNDKDLLDTLKNDDKVNILTSKIDKLVDSNYNSIQSNDSATELVETVDINDCTKKIETDLESYTHSATDTLKYSNTEDEIPLNYNTLENSENETDIHTKDTSNELPVTEKEKLIASNELHENSIANL